MSDKPLPYDWQPSEVLTATIEAYDAWGQEERRTVKWIPYATWGASPS